MTYETIRLETRGRVALVTLDRPKALNALNMALLAELSDALSTISRDEGIGAIVITGSEKAFAAGADIKEMQALGFAEAFLGDFAGGWDAVAATRKPMIAAVAGFALGGGCELAMMCDFIIAADTARFGQPEITLGVLPGMGGTQRMARSIGKAKTMDLCLTGRMMDAEEAERAGLVARVVPAAELIETAMAAAGKIAGFSLPATMMVKEAVNRAFETGLSEGLRFERRQFHSTFALDDQSEGMGAFVEKRPANFRHR
ncbi:enoyl-CoA hydratase [Aureimonas sp. SA4125]|uniref:enoyl-CoA hydratase n=1 Tax=Aureimonas sp. SA4125 TaxID=2826993 RepID=UPI001CC4551F|nr:enoyl-CoA hydratase [Aureimonas sp. SA4125]BDA87147.1 enoyl-CoA hydratase [Aureimonas sp. SA4125]